MITSHVVQSVAPPAFDPHQVAEELLGDCPELSAAKCRGVVDALERAAGAPPVVHADAPTVSPTMQWGIRLLGELQAEGQGLIDQLPARDQPGYRLGLQNLVHGCRADLEAAVRSGEATRIREVTEGLRAACRLALENSRLWAFEARVHPLSRSSAGTRLARSYAQQT